MLNYLIPKDIKVMSEKKKGSEEKETDKEKGTVGKMNNKKTPKKSSSKK